MTVPLSIYSIYAALCQALRIYGIYQTPTPSADMKGGTRAFPGFLQGVQSKVFIPVSDLLVLYRDDFSVYTILYIHKITLSPFWRGVP